MWDNADYPNPKYDEKELGNKFNLDALPPPPPDYRPLGYKSLLCYTKLRKPRLADFERWFKFYFWGFDLEIKKLTTLTMAAALQKLLYYTAENHRPRDYVEFDECKRDAGPRLIDWTKIPWEKKEDELRSLGLWYAPVSRFYPNLPARSARPNEQFIRPANTPRYWRHTWVEQALLPSSPAYNSDVAAGGLSAFVLELARSSNLAPTAKDEVQETIQRTMINFAYRDLKRHPSAARLNFAQYLIAASPIELLQAAIGSFPAVSQVQLCEDDDGMLSIGRGACNRPWAMRGRGPACSKDNYAGICCLIAVGKLMDAGSTNVDRKNSDWYTKLTPLQRAFIELSEVPWDLCTMESGAKMLDDFWMLMGHDNVNSNHDINAIGALWNAVSSGLEQLQIEYEESTSFCECTGVSDTHTEVATHYMTPPVSKNDSNGVTMQTLFNRTFAPRITGPCEECGMANSVHVERGINRLPLRLAVRVPPGASVLEHTQDITFTYREKDTESGDLKDILATYRWLGGIYHDRGSYRVFWNNTKLGEVDNQEVCIYDGLNQGLIAAGKPAAAFQLNGRVPERWWRNKQIPLLIYERVLNPPADVVVEALSAVSQLWTDIQKGVLSLRSQQPWPAVKQEGQPEGYPWKPLIATQPDTKRFHPALSAYVPGPAPPHEDEESARAQEKPASASKKRMMSSVSDDHISIDDATVADRHDGDDDGDDSTVNVAMRPASTASRAFESIERGRKRRRRS
ncbi:uncharacterized protein BDV14DRAFT_198901 [Aspergillus stella-maris]|uniref:uncharacterized protein n=1 Tax=Aspergillus stella-maris TaxID=1810926 RepID=UPI003CCD6562